MNGAVLKEQCNDLPAEYEEDDYHVEYFALTVPVLRSLALTVRQIKRASYDTFDHIIITSEDHPHHHCHALLAGSPSVEGLERFVCRISKINNVWHKQLKTFKEVEFYRDYILAINRHEQKAAGTIPAYFKNGTIFFNPI